ncbi:Uncharacterized protein with a C-terminal OMP (outer membrane protein) domain [Anaerobiospirillum thomasii]|uniref:autotransporter outer membrane beta-barrel domain-containing protein n=1 Tax=Anaerobiospirillum thomasii TaxID=179995 RepID=UPI000D919EDC|nr:autotransporter outer membrane beta-barrel domain-containing protein [Anaerobiospirillum thomasii]SPT67724.1 Uncharacterized protein with a C-terminal OMP (outer membrane protein) domain [Anaerobiospirillum thomasii]
MLSVMGYRNQSFTESGAGIVSHIVDAQTDFRTNADIGLELTYDFSFASVMASAGYQRALCGAYDGMTVSFMDGSSMHICGHNEDKDFIRVQLSAQKAINSNFTLIAGGSAQLSSENNYGLNLALNYAF